MTKFVDVRESVRSSVYVFIDKCRLMGYHPDGSLAALLALYFVKANEKDQVYHELADNVKDLLRHNKSVVDELILDLQSVNHDEYLKVYSSVVDEFVDHMLLNYSQFCNYVLPDSLTALFDGLAKHYGVTSVFNPFAGLASIPMAMKNISVYSQEKSAVAHAIGMVLLDAHGYDYSSFSSKDVFDEWNPIHAECVITVPPFVRRMVEDMGNEIPVGNYGELVVWNFLRSSEKYAYVVVPNGFCFNSNRTTLMHRKSIIDNNSVDAIVALPSNLLKGTGIPTSLLILNKERDVDAPIAFVDASNMFSIDEYKERVLDTDAVLSLILHPGKENSVLVNIDDVRENNSILTPSSYIVHELENVPEGYHIALLKDFVEVIPQNRKYTDSEGRFVSISQLSKEAADYNRLPESFELSSDLKKASKLEEPALLLSTIGVLKPTYCPASPENPVFLHPHVRAFRLKEKWVNPAYLCLQLSKSKGYMVGVFVPHINLSEILRIKVAFPSIETQQSFDEQGRLYSEAMESAKIAKAKELGLQEVINKMKAEYMIEVRNRKHDMKTPMTQLRNTLTLLDAFAKGLPEEQSLKLQGYIDRQRTAVDTLSEIVRHLADEENFATPEVFDIDNILRSFEEKNDRYEIIYMADEIALNEIGDGRAIVKMGKSDFLRLVNNVVGNAIQHGFVDNSVHYGLFISLAVVDGAFMIRFINNGKPLPEGMDKARYGMKGVKGKDSKGQGTGGSVVKSITEHYGGDYDIYTKDASGKLFTVVDIKLPIYQEDEQI